MTCSKCNKEVSEEGKCVECSLPQEECTCPVAEKITEDEVSEESPSSENPVEEKTV